MKSIRQLTMGTEEEKKPEPTKSYEFGKGYSYDRSYDPYDYGSDYTRYSGNNKSYYSNKQAGVITISMLIPNEDLGPCADEMSANYDEIKAENKATEIMYDKIEELLGRNYESSYTIQFQVVPGYGEYEGLATLTPNK